MEALTENGVQNFRRDHPTDDNDGRRKKSTASVDPPSKRQRLSDSEAQDITDEVYDDAIAKLKEECKKKKGRNHATIKELMEVTQQRHRKWLKRRVLWSWKLCASILV